MKKGRGRGEALSDEMSVPLCVCTARGVRVGFCSHSARPLLPLPFRCYTQTLTPLSQHTFASPHSSPYCHQNSALKRNTNISIHLFFFSFAPSEIVFENVNVSSACAVLYCNCIMQCAMRQTYASADRHRLVFN
jgi:hypothetical protein